MKFLFFPVVLTCLFYTTMLSAQSTIIPDQLRCEYWSKPLGIDNSAPALSWVIQANGGRRGVKQTAYQVIVASTLQQIREDKGDVWNSGKVLSDRMNQVVYAGQGLQSSHQYFWKVRIWDEGNKVSSWSQPSQWTMGILKAADWTASWISAAGAEKYAHNYSSSRSDFVSSRHSAETWDFAPKPGDTNFSSILFRKGFRVAPHLVRAIVHVSGLGQYELSINGRKVGDWLLSPGWTVYNKSILYDTYDITSFLTTGANAIGLIVSNGMYNIMPDSIRYVKFLNSYGYLKAMAQISLEYSNGDRRTVSSDTSWQVAPGPITYMNEYGGEDFDSRLLPVGWDRPGFHPDSCWKKAVLYAGAGGGNIGVGTGEVLRGLSCAAPPIKVIDTLRPVKVVCMRKNVWIYDLGQNVSIMPAITLDGPRGSAVRIIPSELLYPDGTIDRRSATQDGVRPAWWQFTKGSDRPEYFFPRFFYQGGRYLQVELIPADGDTIAPVVRRLNGMVIHSSATPVGTFSCSNQLFNRVYRLVRWAQRSNMMSVLTDCPQREKMPWLEQYHLNGPSLRYNFDLTTLFRKAENDMSDSQLGDGFVPNIAPELFHAGEDYTVNGLRNSPEWGSSFIIAPWQQYLFEGDLSLISRYYEPMKRYLAFLDSSATQHILTTGLGDWYDIGPKEPWGSQLTPISFTGTAIYYYDYQLMGRMAKLLGKDEDANRFRVKGDSIRQAFNQKFYHPETGLYATGSNTALAMPLFLHLADEQHRAAMARRLADDIRANGNAFTSGDVGYRFLLKALAMEGYSDVIYDMNNQTERPGYGYQLKKGATSLTEKWDAGVGSFGSQNHFMLGQINEWFFNDLVGIGVNEDGEGAGFSAFVIKPSLVSGISWVNGSYSSVSGLIAVRWHRDKARLRLAVTIPANTSATVFIPGESLEAVMEGGRPATTVPQIRYLRKEGNSLIFHVVSGKYEFVSGMAK